MGEGGAKNGTPAALTPLSVFCKESPIIPAIRKPELVEQAIASRSKLIYLLTGDPENVESMIQKIAGRGEGSDCESRSAERVLARQVCGELPEARGRGRHYFHAPRSAAARAGDRALRNSAHVSAGLGRDGYDQRIN